ncbi:hypothetical protein NX801_30525, partial [Streptomyces sp. LP05-1]
MSKDVRLRPGRTALRVPPGRRPCPAPVVAAACDPVLPGASASERRVAADRQVHRDVTAQA